jgi:hypothetical protein
MDAQGIMRVEGVGKVSLINLVDVTSRLKAESYPSLETTNPALPDYQLSLRRAFLTYGLPQTLTLDHAPSSTIIRRLRLFPRGCICGYWP